jgi:hypothetical protein
MRPLVLLMLLVLAGCRPALQAQGRLVADLQVQDATKAYEAAQRSGDPLDLCVKAKLVAVAYEDARETANATAWRAREREACRLALDAMGVRPPEAPAGGR